MKKILSIGLLFLGLLFAAYYVMGLLTERNLKQNLSSIEASNKYRVKIVNYNRGFFNSKAIINIEIISPAKVLEKNGKRVFHPANTYFTSLPLVIHHGPIIFVDSKIKFGLGYAESHVTIPGHYIKNFANKYTKDSTSPSLNVNVFVNFMTNTVVNISSPKFSLISKNDNSRFEWLGMVSEIDVTRDLSDINGNLNVNGLSWMQDKMLTVLKEVHSNFKLYKGDFDLYLGDSSVSVPSVIVSKGSNNLIEVNNLYLKSNSYINNKLFNSSLQANLDNLLINKKYYKNCSFDLYVRNLDTKKLMDVNSKIKSAQNGTERQRHQAILAILPDLPELLNKGAEIELSDFNVDMQDGNIKGEFILSLAKDENKNPFYLIQKARGNGHIQITKELLIKILQNLYATSDVSTNKEAIENKPNLDSDVSSRNSVIDDQAKTSDVKNLSIDRANVKITELLNSGAIVAMGDNYVIDLKIVQGRLLVNDKSFSMDMLRL